MLTGCAKCPTQPDMRSSRSAAKSSDRLSSGNIQT